MNSIVFRKKVAQPSPIAAAPTSICTTPAVTRLINVAAVELAMCCQKTESRVAIADIPKKPHVAWATGREGNGLTSWSLPSESSSSCHPGKVASIRNDTTLKATDINLVEVSGFLGNQGGQCLGSRDLESKWGLTSDRQKSQYL